MKLASVVVPLILLAGVFMANTEIEEQKRIIIYNTRDLYLDKLEEMGVMCPEVVVAQMCLETNYFTSTIYKENHNLFGMKKPSFRKNYVEGENRKHAVYLSNAHSLLDYIEFQKHVGGNYLKRHNMERFNSNEEYMLFLRRVGYAEDEAYLKKLRKIIQINYEQ